MTTLLADLCRESPLGFNPIETAKFLRLQAVRAPTSAKIGCEKDVYLSLFFSATLQALTRFAGLDVVRKLAVAALLICAVSLGGCSRENPNEIVGVGVVVLNYSDFDLEISVSPPDNPKASSGDGMGKRSGGRVVCCFGLPAQWRPGLKIRARYELEDASGARKFEQLVELPPYPGGKAGDLYIAVHGPNDIEVFSSAVGTSEPGWPGRIKSFPRR